MALTPTRVLIAEDDLDTLNMMANYLKFRLHDVMIDTAMDGPEAIWKIKTNHPNIVLSDFRMPEVDGLGVLRFAHEHGAVTMMITAYPDVELAQQALRDGHITRFFTKPPATAEMIESIQQVIDQLRRVMQRDAAFKRATNAYRSD